MEMSEAEKGRKSNEQRVVESENQELWRQKLFKKVLASKKRTFKLFQSGAKDQDGQQKNEQDEKLLQSRLETKFQRQYADIGHIPGILVPYSQRNKVLKDLGIVESRAPLSGPDHRTAELKIGAGRAARPKSQGEASPRPTKQLNLQALIPADPAKQAGSTSQRPDAKHQTTALSLVSAISSNQTAIALRHKKQTEVQWHAPWALKRVISGHTGWVRCIAVDPMNKFFVTGSNDKTIKFWDLVEGTLKITLTGHINTVRGLAVSDRHPYLFSCGEDKTVKCWDLEQNKVVRQYHGHLSGVLSLALHPELDLLITGGRDSTARMWDMRTKAQVHVLGGHTHSVESIICQADEPQVITGSHDKMIRMWDIRTGSTIKTLTQHKKGVRALVNHHEEHAFASAGSDKIRIWKQPEGDQLRTIADHNAVVNRLALNEDNVLVSGADNGSLQFYDWKSGHCFQKMQSPLQPGSLSSEAAIFDIKFDRSSLRMITAECDKSIKIWKEDTTATPETHPIVKEFV